LVAGSIPVSRSIRLRAPEEVARSGTPRRSLGEVNRRDRDSADLSAEARSAKADVAQLAERVLGKDEVTSSILVIGSSLRPLRGLRLGKPREYRRRLSRRSVAAERLTRRRTRLAMVGPGSSVDEV
jgi:hypothetical protein